MSGNAAGTTTSSTDSGQGSAPLSEPFVAVVTEGTSRRGSSRRVNAPDGSALLNVRRSSRVASSKSHSTPFASEIHPPGSVFITAPPGGKRKIGYAYQVLPPVSEEGAQSNSLINPAGNVDGLRDIATPQLGLDDAVPALAGRKRSASTAASGSGRRGPPPRHMASAADFSPTHFVEPHSDPPIPPAGSPPPYLPIPDHHVHPSSPMTIGPQTTGHVGAPRQTITSYSSPISQNPLIQEADNMQIQTPSPSSRRAPTFRTQDGNEAFEVAEGLLPIREGFTAPGYVPATLVGGITYLVRSPQGRSPPARQPSVGIRLFSEYGDGQRPGSSQAINLLQHVASPGFRLPQQGIPQHSGQRANAPSGFHLPQQGMPQHSGQRANAPSGFHLPQQGTPQKVRRCELFL
jgi:hypothetical protein